MNAESKGGNLLGSDATLSTYIVVSRDRRQARPHYLEQVEGEGAPNKHRLGQNDFSIGRAEDANIRIASGRASRRHAVLVRKAAEYQICDNGSRNGVFLNGLKIHSAILRDGDIVQIADCVFAYHEG